MLHIFSLQRVLLAGSPSPMRSAMLTQLHLLGARPVCMTDCLHEESLDRTLHNGRFTCVIIPDLTALYPGSAQQHLNTLGTLFGEAREAGVPLVMLLGKIGSASEDKTAQLFSHALGLSVSGDPVSVQCIRHDGRIPTRICREALTLGARFLSGARELTGVFSIE